MRNAPIVALAAAGAVIAFAALPAAARQQDRGQDAAALAETRKQLLAKMLEEDRRRPDFSGHWSLVSRSGSPMPTVPDELAVRWSARTSTEVLRTLSMERRFGAEVLSERYTEGIAGGVVGGIAGPGEPPRPYTSSRDDTFWFGYTLIITNERCTGPTRESATCTAHGEMWSVDAGRLRIATTDSSTGSEPATVVASYRKR